MNYACRIAFILGSHINIITYVAIYPSGGGGGGVFSTTLSRLGHTHTHTHTLACTLTHAYVHTHRAMQMAWAVVHVDTHETKKAKLFHFSGEDCIL